MVSVAAGEENQGSAKLARVLRLWVEDFRQKTPNKVVEIAELLLDAGAEVNAESNAYGGGCTALGLVATSGHPERRKIRSRQRLFHEDGSLGPTATKEQLQRGFLWACMYGQYEVVEFLLEHGADLRDQSDTGGTGLHWAAGGAHLSIAQLLIERGAPLEE